ncbi:beta-1,3-galactosyltransferase 1-like [Pomacea canaliculata]|uniref:beta-1,3-galactosyltransferase 1-like n=1 Tax=Pomacea canaliculata TaxID=400727 RepID=UPI000D73C410|nr:beta-1,3-galactosyltransferase 1-like [Pomacea canaliculata]XP_025105309.1 beta-1,3-galactosyltransferase 1-like [Pomacea canaliculata]XP_025105318.1 beta-1,3-galactosyltransferase 1-like [Pomacea canaliculata]XP_025105326.1 beta-1,3-galactosyltransferase 1-like [Pomacea canaliculata]XP_025105334.1 beta-1,3-galactosyltransferase 1-like [Pomacea canaliculata]XP_025105343.1 beta-1,3-galactosyltransferase 1-like [Pomacea canaliculata]XP_025105353.1 beta-1,3-galactosyltransferase 1-like [Pomac
MTNLVDTGAKPCRSICLRACTCVLACFSCRHVIKKLSRPYFTPIFVLSGLSVLMLLHFHRDKSASTDISHSTPHPPVFITRAQMFGVLQGQIGYTRSSRLHFDFPANGQDVQMVQTANNVKSKSRDFSFSYVNKSKEIPVTDASPIHLEIQHNTSLSNVIRSLQLIDDEDYLRDNSSFFRLRPHVVNSFVPELLIQASPLCPEDVPCLLFAVPSVPEHSEQREAIRNTWGSLARGGSWPRRSGPSYEMKVVFFLGVRSEANMTELKAESELYGDIVMGDFVDSYRNLSVKIGFALHWSVTYCKNAQTFIKVDEDTFVNVPLLSDVLNNVSKQHERYVLGYRHAYSKPYVVRQGQWKVEEDAYPLQFFPAYMYGHSYAISHRAISDLVTAYQHMPLVRVEDAFFTGILTKTMGIPRIHCPYFASLMETRWCQLIEDTYVSQTRFRDSSDLHKVWSALLTGKCK